MFLLNYLFIFNCNSFQVLYIQHSRRRRVVSEDRRNVRARLPGRRDGALHLCHGGQGPGRHVLFRGAAAAPRGARGTRRLDA